MMPKQALIVDDSLLAQFVLKKMLKEEDIRAECSGSGEEALEYLKSNIPDIIFLDHTMPGMNGLELLTLLKQDPVTKPIPVMMYTSQEDHHYKEKALGLGAIEVLPKQLKRPDLHRILITLNDKDAEPTIKHEQHDESLEQIVYDAEEALKHETWQQRLSHALEDHQKDSNQQIQLLNERIEHLILSQDEQALKRQMFWSNLFWMLLFCIGLGVFAFIYTQQQQALNSLKTFNSTNISENIPTPQPTITEAAPQKNINKNPISDGIAGDLLELQDYFNTNTIAFGEILLGDKALQILEEIDSIISNESFKGVVLITPIDSTFCVTTNNLTENTLAAPETLVSQCEFTTSNTELTQNISVEVQQFVDTQNQNRKDYQYVINAIQNKAPELEQTMSALEWNRIATSNRQIQFEFQPSL